MSESSLYSRGLRGSRTAATKPSSNGTGMASTEAGMIMDNITKVVKCILTWNENSCTFGGCVETGWGTFAADTHFVLLRSSTTGNIWSRRQENRDIILIKARILESFGLGHRSDSPIIGSSYRCWPGPKLCSKLVSQWVITMAWWRLFGVFDFWCFEFPWFIILKGVTADYVIPGSAGLYTLRSKKSKC